MPVIWNHYAYTIMDENQILTDYEKKFLLMANRKRFNVDPKWKENTTNEAGVYVFFEDDVIVYVGETKSLKARMGDARRTVNHTLRRKIGTQIFSKVLGFQTATSKKKFPNHIEQAIDDYMNKLYVAALPVLFGRSEVEEYLINKYNPKFNSRARRGSITHR